jgi:SAM-dependent methyltransferase
VDPSLDAHLELAALEDDEFVRRAYRLVLRRPPDREASERIRTGLADGSLSRAALLHELVESDEFARLRALEEAIDRARRGETRWLSAPPGDERAIEIPWVLSRYRGEHRVLDLGSAFAEPAYLASLVSLRPRELVGVDLVAAEIPGMRTEVADLRLLPFEDQTFELVLCVSTLEHVGADNSVYGIEADRDEHGMERALAELRRILVRRGRLLVTVPAGANEDHGWFVQLEPDGWTRLFDEAGFGVADSELYELGEDGWGATERLTPGLRYGERGPGASAILAAELRPGRFRLPHRLRRS